MPCPGCNKPVLVEDIVVKSYKGVISVETCGRLIIHKRGRVVAQQRVVAHEGIEVLGALEGKQILSGGPVHIGPKGKWSGDLKAPALSVEEGAVVRPSHFTIPADPLGELRRQARKNRPPDE